MNDSLIKPGGSWRIVSDPTLVGIRPRGTTGRLATTRRRFRLPYTLVELYERYLRFLPWPSEKEIYRIFLKHTPPVREAAFLDVYRRFHGGPFLDGD